MGEVVINSSLNEKRWLVEEYLTPYVRASGFETYMGRGSDAIIRIFAEDKTDGGKTIVIPLVGEVRGDGVSGSQVLEGNEDDMEAFVDELRMNWRRNAVKVPKSSQYRSNLDILRIAKPRLRDWAARRVLKRSIIDQANGIVIPGGNDSDGFPLPDTVITYASATAAQRNTFMVNNVDRIQFGISLANDDSGVWATAAANVDNTNDKLSAAMISMARRRAQATGDMDAAGPAITPYMTAEGGEETMLLLVHRNAMRDLRNDATITAANREAMERGKTNPLFRAGDLYWDGVVIREVPDWPIIAGAGAGGIDITQNVLLGQSALAIGWGQEPRLITDKKQDYGFRPATAIEELIGVKKLSFAGKQYGVYTLVTAAVADA